MVVPVINFNGVSKVIYSGQEMSKVYCGSELVWERKKVEESYREIYTSHLTKEAVLSNRLIEFARNGQKVLNADDIVKVVIGGRVTISGSDIYHISNYETHEMSIKRNSGYSGTVYVFESIEIYLK